MALLASTLQLSITVSLFLHNICLVLDFGCFSNVCFPLQNVQRLHVVLDRYHQSVSKASQLEAEKKELPTTLEAKDRKLKEEVERNIVLVAEADTTMTEISRLKVETHELKGAAAVKVKGQWILRPNYQRGRSSSKLC